MSELQWTQPWFEPWRDPGERVAAAMADGAGLADALNSQDSPPVRFVPQQALPAGVPYEQFIFESGQCPVREGLHDFFNGLCWLQFPQAKRQLNRLQAAEIARTGVGAKRGPVRDAVTVFDENGALLCAPDALWQALVERDWRRLFIELRPLWGAAHLTIFGHALMEKLAAPRKDLTAHVWRAPAPAEGLDAWLAPQLVAERLAAKPFTPLPVLGIPGWCAENANFSFYDDSLVFRRPRAPEQRTTTPPRDLAGP